LAEKRRWLARDIQAQHENEQLPMGSDYGSPKSSTILTSIASPPTTLSHKQEKSFPVSPPSVSGRSTEFTLADQPSPEHLPSLVELKQMAEAVDTTLLRAYIATNDGLVGSLLRVKNYCSIEESEQILMKHKVMLLCYSRT
jgi:hypothetical protein